MHLTSLRSLLLLALLVPLAKLVSPQQQAAAQQWLPAGQTVGQWMWPFPLSLPDGTHLIGLRWVNEKNNDSLYWFDIASFMTEPRMYERQTPGFKAIWDIGDYDSDGRQDLFGDRFEGRPQYLYSPLTDSQEVRTPVAGQMGVQTQAELRYLGDINGDSLNDFFSTPNNSFEAVRIVYGDRDHPFQGPSYVDLPDLRDPLYPDLEPTYVAAIGMLGEKPCLVRLVTERPDWFYYELLELNQEDLQARAPTIKTTSLAKFFPTQPRYGAVVLRTPNVWWLFDGGGKHTSGMKITREEITVVPVPEFWHGGWLRYFGQGGESADYNFPRVMDSDRPFIREDYQTEFVDGIGDVPVSSISYARVADPNTAGVEVLGQARVPMSQRYSSGIGYVTVVPDEDGDGIDDLMVNNMFTEISGGGRNRAVGLYLTSQRPTVSVSEEDTPDAFTISVVDTGTQWRLLSAAHCLSVGVETVHVYDVAGAQVADVSVRVVGPDLLVDKPGNLPNTALFVRIGECGVRVR